MGNETITVLMTPHDLLTAAEKQAYESWPPALRDTFRDLALNRMVLAGSQPRAAVIQAFARCVALGEVNQDQEGTQVELKRLKDTVKLYENALNEVADKLELSAGASQYLILSTIAELRETADKGKTASGQAAALNIMLAQALPYVCVGRKDSDTELARLISEALIAENHE